MVQSGVRMNKIKEWYANRIAKEEISLAGWSRDFSQIMRFETTMRILDIVWGRAQYSVLDFGCGIGDFYNFHRERISNYLGIEFREEARAEMSKRQLTCLPCVPAIWNGAPFDVVVSNAAFGFKEQDPVEDLLQAIYAFRAKGVVVDFFSARRPYGPGMEGYTTFDPLQIVDGICLTTGWRKFIIDHLSMPHAFTVGVFSGPTEWDVREEFIKR
jgi:SAM-dependent methyltransferase